MKNLTKEYNHIKTKKEFYFGKDEYIYKFYEGQRVFQRNISKNRGLG